MALSEDEKKYLEEELARDRAIDTMQLHRSRVAAKSGYANFQRSIYKQRAELQAEVAGERNAAIAEENATSLRTDERLAFEMQRRKCDDYNEAAMRRKLLETAPELKQLRSKLNAAYTNKILRAQMKEKEATKINEKIKDKEAERLLLDSRISEAEYHRMEQQKLIEQQLKYKQELQDQMIYQEQTKRFRYEEFLREKQFIDDLVQRIHEEDERDQYRKMCEKKRTQEDIEAFHAAKEIWRRNNLKMVEEEDRKIKEFIKSKIEVEKQRKQAKSDAAAAKEKVIDNMARQIYIERRNQSERQEIIQELNEQELRHEFERKQREKTEREFRQRIETLSALHLQMQEKKEATRKTAEIDAAYKEELIAKIAEDDRLELLSREKRRLKLMQIRRDVEQMIAEKRLKKIEDMQALLKMDELEREQEEKRAMLIEKERIKMLQEHAQHLLGYLPPGVLKQSDLEHLGDEFAAKLSCLHK